MGMRGFVTVKQLVDIAVGLGTLSKERPGGNAKQRSMPDFDPAVDRAQILEARNDFRIEENQNADNQFQRHTDPEMGFLFVEPEKHRNDEDERQQRAACAGQNQHKEIDGGAGQIVDALVYILVAQEFIAAEDQKEIDHCAVERRVHECTVDAVFGAVGDHKIKEIETVARRDPVKFHSAPDRFEKRHENHDVDNVVEKLGIEFFAVISDEKTNEQIASGVEQADPVFVVG